MQDSAEPSSSSDHPTKYQISGPNPPPDGGQGPSGGCSSSISSTTFPIASPDGGPDTLLVGTVEGFYHQPWTHSQRTDLMSKMRKFGMNAYMYAPKDDHKHRASWKELYTDEESRELTKLIQTCKEQRIIFFYAISPGLDMAYSSGHDLDLLKEKMDQLRAMGCDAFAVLWDDIDVILPSRDSGIFKSLAEAHVYVTNAMFRHLGRPPFITCPVEYCASRASPSVKRSPYLRNLGQGLESDIGIFWTGSHVVSKDITKRELLDLGAVIRRKPVLWDNLHANDYDQQRIFLGPYSGRDPEILPLIRGVLTNPNCEYSLNVPALFSLAAWSECYNRKTGDIRDWNPPAAANRSIPYFLDEVHRHTQLGIHVNNPSGGRQREPRDNLDTEDISLLYELFWLPHSHGTAGAKILVTIRYLLEYAHMQRHIAEALNRNRAAQHGGNSSDDDDDDNDGSATDGDSGPEEKPKTPPPMSFKSSPARSPFKPTKKKSPAASPLRGAAAAAAAASPDVSPSKSQSHSPGKSPTKSPRTPVQPPGGGGGGSGSGGIGGGASAFPASRGGEMAVIDEGEEEEEDLQRNYADCWLKKLDEFEILNQQITTVYEKFSLIENREMFYQIIPYLSGIQVMMLACSRYCTWVKEGCIKPIKSGPTLAGLPGGIAGELQRLYPIKAHDHMPVFYHVYVGRQKMMLLSYFYFPVMETHMHYTTYPMTTNDDKTWLGKQFWNIYVKIFELESFVFSFDLRDFITMLRLTFILSQPDSIAITVNDSLEVPSAILAGTRKVSDAITLLKPEFQPGKKLSQHQVPFITVPSAGKEQLPWDMIVGKYGAILSYTTAFELVFTTLSENIFKFMLFMLFGREPGWACIIVEKSDFLTRSFLKTGCGFSEVHRGRDFGLLEIYYHPEGLEPDENDPKKILFDDDAVIEEEGGHGSDNNVEAMDTDEATGSAEGSSKNG